MEAKITQKEKGEEKYGDALSSRDAAYLVTYDQEQQDLLSMSIGNLPPGKSLTLQLDVVTKLAVVDKSWGLLLSPTFTPLVTKEQADDEEEEKKELPDEATSLA